MHISVLPSAIAQNEMENIGTSDVSKTQYHASLTQALKPRHIDRGSCFSGFVQ